MIAGSGMQESQQFLPECTNPPPLPTFSFTKNTQARHEACAWANAREGAGVVLVS